MCNYVFSKNSFPKEIVNICKANGNTFPGMCQICKAYLKRILLLFQHSVIVLYSYIGMVSKVFGLAQISDSSKLQKKSFVFFDV